MVRDLRRFDGGIDDFRAWLFTIARNRTVDAARASAARPSVAAGDMTTIDLMAASVRPVAPSAETAAMESMSTQRALALVASLPPDQAEMVALRVLGGLDYETVGMIVGRPAGTVRVNVHRGLKQLALRTMAPAAEVRAEVI